MCDSFITYPGTFTARTNSDTHPHVDRNKDALFPLQFGSFETCAFMSPFGNERGTYFSKMHLGENLRLHPMAHILLIANDDVSAFSKADSEGPSGHLWV